MDLSQEDYGGNNLVCLCCEYSSIEILQFLLSHKLSLCKVTKKTSQTPLHLACKRPYNSEMINLILENINYNIPYINLQDNEGNTILHYIVANEDEIEITKRLLYIGINKMLLNKKNYSAFNIAQYSGSIETSNLLNPSKYNEEFPSISKPYEYNNELWDYYYKDLYPKAPSYFSTQINNEGDYYTFQVVVQKEIPRTYSYLLILFDSVFYVCIESGDVYYEDPRSAIFTCPVDTYNKRMIFDESVRIEPSKQTEIQKYKE